MDKSSYGKAEYKKTSEKFTPDSSIFLDCIKAFVSGGIICVLGQFMKNYFSSFTDSDGTALLVNMVFIAAAAILTGFGIYSRLGRFCGAGTIVPITGFANSMVAASIEGKTEGWVLGLGASMFTIAGPVIVYGLGSSFAVGIIYYFVK